MPKLQHRVSIRTTAPAAQRLSDYLADKRMTEAEVTAQALNEFFDRMEREKAATEAHNKLQARTGSDFLDQALNEGDGVYRP